MVLSHRHILLFPPHFIYFTEPNRTRPFESKSTDGDDSFTFTISKQNRNTTWAGGAGQQQQQQPRPRGVESSSSMPPNPETLISRLLPVIFDGDDDDDFQSPIPAIAFSQCRVQSSQRKVGPKPLRDSNEGIRPRKKARQLTTVGKENGARKRTGVFDLATGNEGGSFGKSVEMDEVGMGQKEILRVVENRVSDGGIGCGVSDIVEKDITGFRESKNLGDGGPCEGHLGDFTDCVKVTGSEGHGSPGIEPERDDILKSVEANALQNGHSYLRKYEDSIECIIKSKSGGPDTSYSKSGDSSDSMRCEGLMAGNVASYTISIESRLLRSQVKPRPTDEDELDDNDPGTQLKELMNLCSQMGDEKNMDDGIILSDGEDLGDQEYERQSGKVKCPLCAIDISGMSEERRNIHTNGCLDKSNNLEMTATINRSNDSSRSSLPVSPVAEFLQSLGLSKYEDAFTNEEIDWNTLQWLTEEDLLSIGVVPLGPRKKIAHALSDLRKGNSLGQDTIPKSTTHIAEESSKPSVVMNKLITEYFRGSSSNGTRVATTIRTPVEIEKRKKDNFHKKTATRSRVGNTKLRDIPSWCCIPGTPFRVDAFRFLRGDCSHWFLTHFHMDHYQGLTKSFHHGKIYCSSITANLVNMKIGVPWDRLHVLPLNQKISIAGVDVVFLDANHCPGSVIILFEPPNGKAVLHTGDFRFCEAVASSAILQSCHVHTLILDTTYCNPQYDFPKQEAVIQFVIDAIQAEAFNPKTLFLIGSYTIGKERLFLEVGRFLRKKVYVGIAKLRLLQCLCLPEEDMQWFTVNEMESNIHVVPMWTIASFKRMKQITNQYSGRYNLVVAFSPTGWTFGKGKKKSPGRRWQQGTIIRYEVPYSEHSSFSELQEFVQFISPEVLIPSVNNDSPESADAMAALLMSHILPGDIS